ncbi:hypothetical protein G5B30_12025 [Sphingobacterium sp. SGG-5]|uniref:PL29 family lyase N-terminal domain-containing protein n=1 Tax=Sphingobacterium sp. SGG-5 TaxID=2710881 RepID=UPI0013EB274A|nr:PL29 family lyase N-terminal domain-containing protein [Sphingobacterium sp. SGG-5]NGM62643.1 hypothetical protein [Sphingobacterium sp. SGG-5]
MQKQQWFFRLMLLGMIFLCSQCKKETEDTQSLPPAGDVETWVDMANEDIASLKAIVTAIEQESLIESAETVGELTHLHFVDGSSATVRVDYASYPSPLVGAHLIDGDYYWTVVNGTGTSAVRLLKDKDRKNYPVEEGQVPSMLVNEAGNWVVSLEGAEEELFNADGEPFRAIGRKSLFSGVTFDVDSNATITSNETSGKSYVIPRDRPFTFLIDRPENEVLTIASGFAIAVDFQQVGIEELEFDFPEAWSATYELDAAQKTGVLYITSPMGIEPEFDEEGILTVRAKDQYGRELQRKIPVKVEVGVVNYASVSLTDVASGVDITGATFTFTESAESTNVKDVTAVKAEDTFRLMLPDGFPELRKVTFATAGGSFDYYFAPNTILTIGEQSLSIAPPKLGDYWKGGMIVHIDQTLPLSGITAYKITGKVMHVSIRGTGTLAAERTPWYLNGSTDILGAHSDTDGKANTTAIINVLGVGSNDNYIARWVIRVRAGGYDDWYLGAIRDYRYFHEAWAPNSGSDQDQINQKIAEMGGNIVLGSTRQTQFWTSTNAENTTADPERAKTRAYMYSPLLSDPMANTGLKTAGLYGMAFRDFD